MSRPCSTCASPRMRNGTSPLHLRPLPTSSASASGTPTTAISQAASSSFPTAGRSSRRSAAIPMPPSFSAASASRSCRRPCSSTAGRISLSPAKARSRSCSCSLPWNPARNCRTARSWIAYRGCCGGTSPACSAVQHRRRRWNACRCGRGHSSTIAATSRPGGRRASRRSADVRCNACTAPTPWQKAGAYGSSLRGGSWKSCARSLHRESTTSTAATAS